MSTTAPVRPVTTPPARVLLRQAAKDSDTAAASILDRILDPEQRASVEVAAFQSSV